MIRPSLACLFVLSGALSACSGSKDPTSSGDPTPTPGPTNSQTTSHVAVNERASWTTNKQRDEVVVTDSKLSFPAAGNEALLQKVAGDILVSDRMSGSGATNAYGFMRKVVSVAKVGSAIEVTTEPAYLDEILVGTFEVVGAPGDLTLMDLGTSAPSGAAPGTQSSHGSFLGGPGFRVQDNVGIDKSFDLGFDKSDITFFTANVGGLDIPLSKGKVSVSLQGDLKLSEASFHFKPTIKFGGDISVPGGFFDKFNPSNYVKEFHLEADGDVEAKLVLAAAGKLAVEGAVDKDALEGLASKVNSALKKAPQSVTIPVISLPFIGPPLPTPLGPIPITYNFKIDLECTAGLSGGFQASAGFDAKASAAFGMKYTKDNGWEKISNLDFSFTPIGPNVTAGGSAEFTCSLKPTLETKLAGVAGPFASVSAYVKGSAEYEEKCAGDGKAGKPNAEAKVSLKAGVAVNVGAEIEIFKVKLAKANFPLYDKSWPIADKSWDLGTDGAIGWCTVDSQAGGSGGTGGAGGSGGSGDGGSAGSGASSGSGSGEGGNGAGGDGSAGFGAGGSGLGGQGAGGTGTPSCGNGKIEGLEQCDGSDVGGLDCSDITLATGTLKCKADCTFDTSGCNSGATCGHDACTDGVALLDTCNACTTAVCKANDYCCTVAWDIACVEAAKGHSECGCK
jgi:hypothetical protein